MNTIDAAEGAAQSSVGGAGVVNRGCVPCWNPAVCTDRASLRDGYHHIVRSDGGSCNCRRRWVMPMSRDDVRAGTAKPRMWWGWLGRLIAPVLGVPS